MSFLPLFYRLIVRPLGREPGRTALTVFAVALGVAVVIAIELAGRAATGSFQSSLETLAGDSSIEISAIGGLDESLLADLASLPYPLRFSPRVEGYARLASRRETAPLFGIDLIGDPLLREKAKEGSFDIDFLTASDSVWVGSRLAAAPGETLELTINDISHTVTVRGVLDAKGFPGVSLENVIVMDIAAAQRTLRKQGLLDRIYAYVPESDESQDWAAILEAALPSGVTVEAAGARTVENRKMLGAFGWNLRILSYISLIVGAFLIYNTISVSVVRRRPEIGVLRALGATRAAVRAAFLAEAAFLGVAGASLGVFLGRLLGAGALRLMSATVETLYASGSVGEIRFDLAAWLTALVAGPGVAILAAAGPAHEASQVPPTEAMARGRRDYLSRLRSGRNLGAAVLLAAAAWAACQAPPIDGKPLFGYLAAILLIGALALSAPAVSQFAAGTVSRRAYRLLGVEGFLAPRSLIASLGRTAVLVAALATAAAMMVSIGVMVGSFRETVAVWMDSQLRADLYLRPAGGASADRFPTLDPEIPDRIAKLPGVLAVDRFRAYPIRYEGMPATLGAGETSVHGRLGNIRLMAGADSAEVLDKLPSGNFVLISEPFSSKHGLRPGHSLKLPLRGQAVSFEVLAIYYDYSSEKGYVIADRNVLLRYLPDPAPTNVAVYLKPDADLEAVRESITTAAEGSDLFIAPNRSLRRQALEIFDRTFAITYALEAVAVLVAILGMAGALLALVIDRRREIGVLRFLGASREQVRKLILLEAALLGLIANGIGVVLGGALSLVLIYVINKQSFGWTIQFHWPVGLLLAALSLIYVACVASALYPARVAAALNPIEVMHEE